MKDPIKFLNTPTSIAPLAVFRILFGFIMLVSIVRFTTKGWIRSLYLDPQFHFSYYGFEWVKPLGPTGMYLLFTIMGITALMVMLGYKYRVAILLFFLSFTYVELIDKTNYLNHYYFVSVISFLLILLPAHRNYSIDSWLKPSLKVTQVPRWTIFIIQLQLAIVYIYAGIAKLNAEWLLEAMPLKIWLPANSHLPLIGSWLELPETAYIFSWTGAIYDLSIVFFLLYKRTRLTAYAAVIVFHLSTAILFQIGMFPYIMILATLIFFPPDFHQKLISGVSNWLHFTKMGGKETGLQSGNLLPYKKSLSWMLGVVLVLHFTVQLLLPLRNKLYSGDLLWTEQGYRFSWRVMLMEKAGHAVFQITDPISKRSWEASNYRYLTPNQEKMMATQPDMILQFAHYLEQQYQMQGYGELEITANCYVTLNGNRSQPFIDPQTDLTQLQDGWADKGWIRPMNHSGNQISSRR